MTLEQKGPTLTSIRSPIHNKGASAATEYLRELYLDRGMTLESMAAFFECSPTTVRRWLIKAGVPIRSTGPRGSFGRKLTAETVRTIRARLAKGEGQSTLGREYGVSRQVIFAIKTRQIWKDLDGE